MVINTKGSRDYITPTKPGAMGSVRALQQRALIRGWKIYGKERPCVIINDTTYINPFLWAGTLMVVPISHAASSEWSIPLVLTDGAERSVAFAELTEWCKLNFGAVRDYGKISGIVAEETFQLIKEGVNLLINCSSFAELDAYFAKAKDYKVRLLNEYGVSSYEYKRVYTKDGNTGDFYTLFADGKDIPTPGRNLKKPFTKPSKLPEDREDCPRDVMEEGLGKYEPIGEGSEYLNDVKTIYKDSDQVETKAPEKKTRKKGTGFSSLKDALDSLNLNLPEEKVQEEKPLPYSVQYRINSGTRVIASNQTDDTLIRFMQRIDACGDYKNLLKVENLESIPGMYRRYQSFCRELTARGLEDRIAAWKFNSTLAADEKAAKSAPPRRV